MNMKKFVKSLIKISLFLFLAGIVTLFYSYSVEPKKLTLVRKDVYLPHYYSEHNGLKIVVISDFHISNHGCDLEKLKKAVKIANEQNPHYIFLLGDFDSLSIKNNHYDENEVSKILSGFCAKDGVISVLGNHDVYPGTIKPVIKKAGIKLLENDKLVRTVNGKPFVIYGLKDLWHFKPNVKKLALKGNNGGSVILLSHNPDLFPDVPSFVSLTLSGHTHGGQVCLPFLGGIFNPSKYGQRYNKGLIVENGKCLYVTSGIGQAVPFRLGVPPEIVILTLYSQDDYPLEKITNTKPLKGLHHGLNKQGYKLYKNLRENYPDLKVYLPEI